ncbi:dihydrodipicolinate synthase family protein [Aminivibrio sp.]|jgi:4-hydroxy-2-oxoglutarate aldolase|uniref:dihydrodipicolinate synthase family protein n=1 Tax=Aminivibrio sp. TaxID=1872489 RepID=UPI001A3D931B|nr:dihydrodipicolinate synthase family protein [Aminivibrio sp.]MBL3540150.1 dihydrodipicolinate synthase family protein [Aminivibrio sp.]
MKKVRGIFAPIATAFDASGEVDYSTFAENTVAFGATKLSGLVVLGSNGEFTLLSHEEKVKLVETARNHLPAEKMVIAGTGCESFKETLQLTKECAAVGADVALVVTPNYYKKDMHEAALGNFYTMLADASPIPVMIYNMPGNSGVNVPSSLTLKLAAHPNITGIKDSGGNIVQISEVLAKAPEGFSVFAGSGSYLLATLLLGGVGGTLAVANVVPDYCAEIQENFEKGDIEKARKMQLALLPLNAAVTSRFGIGGMKAAMDMVGFKGGLPRLPILPAGEETRKEIARILKELGIPTV